MSINKIVKAITLLNVCIQRILQYSCVDFPDVDFKEQEIWNPGHLVTATSKIWTPSRLAKAALMVFNKLLSKLLSVNEVFNQTCFASYFQGMQTQSHHMTSTLKVSN
jgi:hypothetical protein